MKINELLIGTTGKALDDAYDKYGIRIDEGFVEALVSPLTPKDYIVTESRLANGHTVIIGDRFFKSRELTLTFRIVAEDKGTMEDMRKDLRAKRDAFYELLYSLTIDICLPSEDAKKFYHLVYKDKSNTFAYNLAKTSCLISVKFDEPNPRDNEPTKLSTDVLNKGDIFVPIWGDEPEIVNPDRGEVEAGGIVTPENGEINIMNP